MNQIFRFFNKICINKPYLNIGLILYCCFLVSVAKAQDSSTKKEVYVDTSILNINADSIIEGMPVPVLDNKIKDKVHTPRGATLRSLILPGWGQIYNKEYWKVPIVVGAVAVPIATFIFYSKQKNIANTAYNIAFEGSTYGQNKGADWVTAQLEAKGKKYEDYLKAWNSLQETSTSTASTQFLSNVQSWRNSYRRYVDYSALWGLILWGLNVADATVFAHLKQFDVSDDLSLKMRPTYFPIARTPGISLLFTLK